MASLEEQGKKSVLLVSIPSTGGKEGTENAQHLESLLPHGPPLGAEHGWYKSETRR